MLHAEIVLLRLDNRETVTFKKALGRSPFEEAEKDVDDHRIVEAPSVRHPIQRATASKLSSWSELNTERIPRCCPEFPWSLETCGNSMSMVGRSVGDAWFGASSPDE
jgi:hypothetical protein